jgi:hypothetical protein
LITFLTALSTLTAGALLPESPARAASLDQALAKSLLGPEDPIDPVLSSLANARLVRDVVAPSPGQVTVPAVPLGFAFTGVQLGPLDITGTPAAALEVEAFTDRLHRRGVDTSGTTWTVYTLPAVKDAPDADPGGAGTSEVDGPLGSALIVPAGTKVELVGAVFEHGELHTKTMFTASPDGRASGTREMSAMAAPSDSDSFVRDGGLGCVDRKQNNTAFYDPCQDFFFLENDGDPARRYWASQMHGTGKGRGLWTLNSLEVSSRRSDGSAPQEWVDWDPGADATTNCHTQTVSVSYAGAGLSLDQQHCEEWDIDKDADGADFANWWRGHVRRKERETAAMTLTRLQNGDLPKLLVSFDYYANP